MSDSFSHCCDMIVASLSSEFSNGMHFRISLFPVMKICIKGHL